MLKDTLSFWEDWQSWADVYGIEYQPPQNVIQVKDQVSVIQAAVNDAGITTRLGLACKGIKRTREVGCVNQAG